MKTTVKILVGVFIIGGGIGYFMYKAMQSSRAYYYSVDEFSANRAAVKNYSLRIAGRVKPSSVARNLQTMNLTFILAGSKTEIPVYYEGSVPDNFAENRVVVIEGRLDTTGIFLADTLIIFAGRKYRASHNLLPITPAARPYQGSSTHFGISRLKRNSFF